MKTYLNAWWRGIGVIGLFFCFSIVIGIVGLLADALPERLQLVLGLPLFILVVPPMLFWTFRWLYPEAVAARTRFSGQGSPE